MQYNTIQYNTYIKYARNMQYNTINKIYTKYAIQYNTYIKYATNIQYNTIQYILKYASKSVILCTLLSLVFIFFQLTMICIVNTLHKRNN